MADGPMGNNLGIHTEYGSKKEPKTIFLDSMKDWFSFLERGFPSTNSNSDESGRFRIIFRAGVAALMYGGIGEDRNKY